MSDIEHNAAICSVNAESQSLDVPQGRSQRNCHDTVDSGGAPKDQRPRRALGILNDKETDEVPGSVLLLPGVVKRNVPLGMQHAPNAILSSSQNLPLASQTPNETINGCEPSVEIKKTSKDGKTILVPQPEETKNDPLNWSAPRRDTALLSIGLYCMIGGGMTPLLAAGFTNVAAEYHVSVPRVALTTGLYMMGLGVGNVINSPTAIAYGKRPVYLLNSFGFIVSAVWCALSPSFPSLLAARVFQGFFVSPVECLPSASIAEIYFLHERAYRLGIYTLLLLGGKNLVPLVSAAIIQSLGWRWVFWITAILVGFCSILLFFFVPETFWDRTPRPHELQLHLKPALAHFHKHSDSNARKNSFIEHNESETLQKSQSSGRDNAHHERPDLANGGSKREKEACTPLDPDKTKDNEQHANVVLSQSQAFNASSTRPGLDPEKTNTQDRREAHRDCPNLEPNKPTRPQTLGHQWTDYYRDSPPKTYMDTLKPLNGRINRDSWFRVAARPFVLFAYPSILWSTAVYSLSIGWLIVLSESAAEIYRSPDTYRFSALSTGLIYISPFIGGILGTAVAGKLSDIIVRFMARRNEGVYEPEFRLVMAIPVSISTTIGLMGYGWSAQNRDSWIVPTVFFGIISFGCSLGSTTAITFAVDSYRQYAGEALVTLNFSKNIFHGLVFSLFFNGWLAADGSKEVFLALGGIQLGVLLFSIPMYIYGKRARMWTVRRNFMESF